MLQSHVTTAFNSLKGYSASIETTDTKEGSTRRVVSTANVKFLKPDLFHIEILSNSDDPKKTGTKAVWRGGSTLRVKPSGLLGFARVDLPTSDNRLVTENKWRIDQISLRTNIASFLDPKAQITMLGRGQLGSSTLVYCDVKGSLKVTKCDHIKMGFDLESKLPVYADFLQG